MLRYGLYAAYSVIEICRRGCEFLVAALAAVLFGVCGDPVFTVGAGKVYDDVRLGFGGMVAALVGTGEGNACVRICFSVCQGSLRMIRSNVLEVGGFLDELAVWTVLTHKLEILLMVLLHMVVHGVLFFTLLVAVRTDKYTRLVANVHSCVL
jgi:hypothetical protein